MLWQMLALEMPFAKYESNLRLFYDEIHCGPKYVRPALNDAWSIPLHICLERGWAQDPKERLEMKHVEDILKKEIIRIRKGDSSGLQHHKRRSTFVFRQ